jgi:hypothetical protein
VKFNSALIRLSKGLFAYQVFLVATPLPTVDTLLDHSIAASGTRQSALHTERVGREAALPSA